MTLTPAVVQTIALQVAVAVLTLAFGLQALRVAPRPTTAPRTAAWYVAGITFTFEGVVAVIHASAAVAAATIAPEGTGFYQIYADLSPATNDARSVLVLGFAAGMVWLLLLGRPVPPARAIVAATCLLMLVGFVAGLLTEPPVDQNRGADHLHWMSLQGAATAVLLFAALYRGMMLDRVDWLLWTALALYAAHEALSSNIQGVLAWAGFGGGWAPPLRSMMWVGLVAACVMVACSMRRLAIARAGGYAPGLLQRLRG